MGNFSSTLGYFFREASDNTELHPFDFLFKSCTLFIWVCPVFQLLESSEEGDEKAITAMGLLNTLETILTVMEDKEEVHAQLEPVILQVSGITKFDMKLYYLQTFVNDVMQVGVSFVAMNRVVSKISIVV